MASLTDENETIFDESNFPIVKIIFGKTINNDEDFEKFKNKWLELYLHEKKFYLIFDTSNIESIPINYLYKLTRFTKKLKKLKIQYLQASVLLIKNSLIRNLYKLLKFFFTQRRKNTKRDCYCTSSIRVSLWKIKICS